MPCVKTVDFEKPKIHSYKLYKIPEIENYSYKARRISVKKERPHKLEPIYVK